MDYEKKYKEITIGLLKCTDNIDNEYPDCNGFEKSVISLRRNGWTYDAIQKKLGMPSKKEISSALKKWAPELIDNSKKKYISVSKWESELYNILSHTDRVDYEIEDEDSKFFIRDHKIIYVDWSGEEIEFNKLNDVMQQQFLIAIKQQLNGE